MIFSSSWVIALLVALVALGIYGWAKWFKVFNSPDGERYARSYTQGPLAPLPAQAQADDAARRAEAARQKPGP